MKEIIFLFMVLPVIVLAQSKADSIQSKTDTIKISEEVYNCTDKVYNNIDALKLLVQRLASNPEYFRSVHKELMNDPETRAMLQDLIRSGRDMMGTRKDRTGNNNELEN